VGVLSGRIVGVDVARCLALAFMMSVHIIGRDTTGVPGLVRDIGGGRASALFAVLAGVSLALMTGRQQPPSGDALRAARWSVVGRAAVIGSIGLSLGLLGSGAAVILVNYAALFVVACLFLGLRARPLTLLAAGWLVLSPVAGHLLRPIVRPGPGRVQSWLSLGDPVQFLSHLFLTGYYPVLQWTAYVLAGLAIGRSAALSLASSRDGASREGATHDGSSREGATRLLALGAVLAGGAQALSGLLLDTAGGREHLLVPPGSPVFGLPLAEVLVNSMYGTTPTTTWWWLAAAAPHSATPLDLLHTTGTALLVLGACLLAVPAVRRTRAGAAVLFPVVSAGAMTLTLYTLHVVALAETRGYPEVAVAVAQAPGRGWLTHVVVALLLATLWRGTALRLGATGRGPLEAAATSVGRSLSASMS